MIPRTFYFSVFAILAFAAQADAELVTYRFSGELDIDASVIDPTYWPGVSLGDWPGISLGDRFEGTVTFDTSPQMSTPGDHGSIIYDWAPGSQGPAATVHVGHTDFFWSPGSRQFAWVRNGVDEDRLMISLSRSFVSGNYPGNETLYFNFRDPDSAAFSNNSFPALIDFGLFEGAEFQIGRTIDLTPWPASLAELHLRGTILSFAAIPEPRTCLFVTIASLLAIPLAIHRRPSGRLPKSLCR